MRSLLTKMRQIRVQFRAKQLHQTQAKQLDKSQGIKLSKFRPKKETAINKTAYTHHFKAYLDNIPIP